MKRNRYNHWILFVAAAITFALGQDPQAEEIMRRALTGDSWDDMQATVTLVLRNARGEERVREMAMFSMEDAEGLNHMLMRILAPADVKGTGFLTLETTGEDDEQYLYIPALRRVKKITASGRGGNFMSSDFTYYDVGMPELEDWTYSLQGEDEYEGRSCWLIECLPVSKKILNDTGYGKIVRWVDKENYNIPYSEFYDKSMTRWKTFVVREFQRINDTDFASDMIMRDLFTDHTSEMSFDNIRVDTGISAGIFTIRYLRRRP